MEVTIRPVDTAHADVGFEDDADLTDKVVLRGLLQWARSRKVFYLHLYSHGKLKHTCFVWDERPNESERLIAEMEPLPVRNCFECKVCRGQVDRHKLVFQCRECKAIGDLYTGIMSPTKDFDFSRLGA